MDKLHTPLFYKSQVLAKEVCFLSTMLQETIKPKKAPQFEQRRGFLQTRSSGPSISPDKESQVDRRLYSPLIYLI